MPALKEIQGIGKASLELLEAAGIRDAAHLAEQNPKSLLEELRKANETIGVVKRPAGETTILKWISNAKDLTTTEEDTEEIQDPAPAQVPVDYEKNPEVAAMLNEAPPAIPLPGKVMMERKLRVSDVPAGLLLNRYSGDLDVRISTAVSSQPDSSVPPPTKQNFSKPTAKGRTFEGARLQANATSVQVSSDDGEDRVSLIRSPRESTNRGKNPNSRRFVRGVLHTHPWSMRIGAVVSLLLIVNLPLGIISAFLLLLSRELPEEFHWVPEWILIFPVALPIVGFGYLIWGFSGKCRICTQKVFVHKGALKHIKAHRLPGMGYVVPLCIHLLLFNWFRCSSCGTPVRLKK
ncbi:MAG: DUF4332 domain-containing protein [Luteolibacter sp.]